MSAEVGANPRQRAAHLGPERRRPEVLDAALAIAVESGVAAVTMSTVAERLGVTRPVVYACYVSRGEMLAALLEREERRLLDEVLAALPNGSLPAGPRRALVGGVQALLRTVQARPESWRVLFTAMSDPTITESFTRARSVVAGRMSGPLGLVLQLNGTEGLDRKLPLLVELVISVGESAVRTLLDGAQGWTPDELGEQVGKFLFHALDNA